MVMKFSEKFEFINSQMQMKSIQYKKLHPLKFN